MVYQDPISRLQSGDRRGAGLTTMNRRSNTRPGKAPGDVNAGFFKGHALGKRRNGEMNGLTGSNDDGNVYLSTGPVMKRGGKARFSVDRELKHHGVGGAARPPLGSDCRTWSGGCPKGSGFSFGDSHHRDSYHKDSMSKTHPGDMDFTTKKGNLVYHRMGHDVREMRRPYEPSGRTSGSGLWASGKSSGGKLSIRKKPCLNCGGLKS